jgi:hypothetical protein
MSPDLVTMIGRVAGLREASASSTATEALVAQIEDRLTEGYAWALAGDAWSMRIEQRLREPGSDTLVVVDDGDHRALAREHACFCRDLVALRRELAALRRERDRLRAYGRVRSG